MRDRSSLRIDAGPESLLTTVVETDLDPDFEEDAEDTQTVEEWFETGAGRESELCTRRTVVRTGAVGLGGIFGRGF